jgi:hypothetical protein
MLLRFLKTYKPRLITLKGQFSEAAKAPQEPFLTFQQIKETLPE